MTQENTEEREFAEKFIESMDADKIDLGELIGGDGADEKAYLRWQADQEARERSERQKRK